MPSLLAGDTRMIVIKYDSVDSAETVIIPVRGDAGVDLGAVGRALGLESSSVRLNGHFVSRGLELVSTLSWESLLSFFASRGHPVGSSPLDPILVQGKPVSHAGWISSSNMTDGYYPLKRKDTRNDACSPKRCRVLDDSSSMQSTGTEVDGGCYMKRQFKLNEEQPSKKGKIEKCISGFFEEASKLPTVPPETGFSCSFINEFGKRLRVDDMSKAISCKKVMMFSTREVDD